MADYVCVICVNQQLLSVAWYVAGTESGLQSQSHRFQRGMACGGYGVRFAITKSQVQLQAIHSHTLKFNAPTNTL